MSDARLFTVRPSKQARSDHKDAFRIYLSSSSLAALKLRAGDICSVNTPDGSPKTAVAWTAAESIQSTVVQTSRTFQDCYEIKVGEKIFISRAEGLLEGIDRVYITECSDVDRLTRYGGPIPPKEKDHWAFALRFPLSRCELVAVGLTFDVELIGQRRSFKVANIKTATRNPANTLFRFADSSEIRIDDEIDGVPEEAPSAIQVKPSGLGGLSRQIDSINESLADFSLGQKFRMPSFYEHSRGILLYGPKGTGKSALLHQIQAAGWKKTFSLGSSMFSRNISDSETKVRNVFQEAVRCQPSAIIIDQLDFIAPKRASLDSQSLTSVLCECLDMAKSALVLVVAATRHPNDVDDALRTPHRLAIEIEMQVPTAQDRAEILRAICGSSTRQLSEELIETIAEKTHGYVGADLFALLQLVCRKARQRQLCQSHSPTRLCDVTSSPDLVAGVEHIEENMVVDLDIEESDVMSALQETRPTAMREVFLETPKVRWTDIGGQHDIKKRLQKAVERPLKFPERMKRLNVKSKKGILLYGPPGCSKTLMVKALATEAGLNFLAVKGAEILSMYVGESERALREIFRKARSARPSIIFFDEIDAIASRRNSSHGGVNVLTTLLNEMDGIEELKNVLVIAATNKPDVIDPALMRPGRLDNILYIGLPDFDARKEILNIWFRKSVVHPEVDLEELAELTHGYSGAEIVSICETAGDAALDEEEETGQEQDVRWEHFKYALEQVQRQITDAVREEYERWGKHRPDVAIHACLFQVRRVSSTSCLPGHLKADRHVAQCMRWISKDDHGVQCPLEEVQGRSAGVHPLSMTMAAATNIVLEAGLGLRRELQSYTEPKQWTSKKFKVEKLTKNVTTSHLREIFGSFGDIKSLELPMNRTFMTNRGTAYILYHDPADAEAAVSHMHEAQLDGAVLNVSIVLPRRAFSRSPPPAENGRGGSGRRSMAVRGPWSDMTYTDRALCRAQGHGVAHCHLSQIRALDPQQGDEPTSEWTALGTVNAAVQVIAVMVTAVIAMKIEAGAGAGAEFIAWMPQGNNLEKLIVYRTSVSY
ncbi:hypothetical protein KXW98_005866 [Aspergillus fumigatus]|nr:hypothetical protein CNMCM8714_005270 [Aspergillus fumigatus]KAF4259147.1 hypothetical protein CNMCM8057_002888 [Aspergillus fumigatus]KAF4266812.1 hypothetical protein CNMCM8812_002543 [Aspergillus fumigatus]KAF4280772.1 hypothetical protein CNMCM8689_001524 [Aspergillus fumigatus]KAF4290448.1 hypothetical protein CNMCM8686_001136 [Aspergillus fumigatus]